MCCHVLERGHDQRLSKDLAQLAERHSGLGVWVGAIGAIAAIFAAWLLARAEYLRASTSKMGE